MTRKNKQIRMITNEIRADSGTLETEMIIEGYFSVFDTPTELWENVFETIVTGAFDKCLKSDVRALTNHDTTLVLGRTKAGTLLLSVDKRGLKGKIIINKDDIDAVNLYQRVKRGDIDQCSFGFDIIDETILKKEDGSTHFMINEVDLMEVSVCTFPAYAETSVEARKKDFKLSQKREIEKRKFELRERIKNVKTT